MAAATDAATTLPGTLTRQLYNVGAPGRQGIAKRAVKDTAKAAIELQGGVNKRADKSQGQSAVVRCSRAWGAVRQ